MFNSLFVGWFVVVVVFFGFVFWRNSLLFGLCEASLQVFWVHVHEPSCWCWFGVCLFFPFWSLWRGLCKFLGCLLGLLTCPDLRPIFYHGFLKHIVVVDLRLSFMLQPCGAWKWTDNMKHTHHPPRSSFLSIHLIWYSRREREMGFCPPPSIQRHSCIRRIGWRICTTAENSTPTARSRVHSWTAEMKERGRRRRRSSPPAVAFSPLGGCKAFFSRGWCLDFAGNRWEEDVMIRRRCCSNKRRKRTKHQQPKLDKTSAFVEEEEEERTQWTVLRRRRRLMCTKFCISLFWPSSSSSSTLSRPLLHPFKALWSWRPRPSSNSHVCSLFCQQQTQP